MQATFERPYTEINTQNRHFSVTTALFTHAFVEIVKIMHSDVHIHMVHIRMLPFL